MTGVAAVAGPVGDDAGEADDGDEGAGGGVDVRVGGAQVREVQAVHFVRGGGEGGDGAGFEGEGAVFGRGRDVVDGGWFAAHV